MPTSLFKPRARYRQPWTGHVAVLAPGAIPTTDYYVTSRLANIAPDAVSRFDANGPIDAATAALHGGTFWVIVRHASAAWLDFIRQHRSRWSGVAFLMDDDIPGAWRSRDVPLDYGLWTTGRYLGVKRKLSLVCDRVWLSTPGLQQRYVDVATTLVPPLAFEPGRAAAPVGTRRWGYHGTRIHQREIRWLLPLVEAVQHALPAAHFEIFGDARVARWFRHIPRVAVHAPIPWPDYVRHCKASHLAVSLAPLLPGRFNAMRSHTKAFDIARSGAVGVFSARDPYAGMLRSSGAVLLPDDIPAWAEAVVGLLHDDAVRLERYACFTAWQAQQGLEKDLSQLLQRQPGSE